MLTSPRTSPRSTPTTRPPSTVPTCWLTSICAAPSWDASRASGSGAATIAAPHSGQKCVHLDMLWLHLGQFMLRSARVYHVPCALPLRTDAADPRSRHVLARPDVLPYRSPSPGHLLGLEAHDPTALLHLLDDLKAGAHLVKERREHRSQFLVFGKLLIQNIFEDRRVALGFFFEASQSVRRLLIPGPFGPKGCEHSLRLLISIFASISYE